jgi:hypothetical protein
LAVEYFVDKPPGSKEQHLSNKEDIVNAFLFSKRCIAVAEMIISLHKNNFTPFNLGLTLQLYHGYGSKHLIETLHAFGSCASYTEHPTMKGGS